MNKITRVLLLLTLALLLFAGVLYYVTDRIAKRLYPLSYTQTVERYAKQYGVDKALVFAVINVESGFRADAVSPRGAIGLMQLTPETYRWAVMRRGGAVKGLSDEDLYEPDINIRYGVYVLSLHISEFADTDTALCAYNAGRSAVNGWLSDERYSADGLTVTNIPYAETREYVKKVNRAKKAYDKLYFQKEN